MNKPQIQTLLARRDRIVKYFEKKIEERGEQAVLFDLLHPGRMRRSSGWITAQPQESGELRVVESSSPVAMARGQGPQLS